MSCKAHGSEQNNILRVLIRGGQGGQHLFTGFHVQLRL
uniref:Uncharacterized protein n=1 Tax=Anguilla anguilla TaxID=7936 RepID=A0A0E9RVD5_ANGAN